MLHYVHSAGPDAMYSLGKCCTVYTMKAPDEIYSLGKCCTVYPAQAQMQSIH